MKSADPTHLQYLDHLELRLEKRAAAGTFVIERGVPAAEGAVVMTEQRLGLTLPAQVRDFYRRTNGFAVVTPRFRALGLDALALDGGLLPFAVFADEHVVAFHTEGLNDACQWDIVVASDRRRLTLTMASFCTNKIWAWLERGRRVWSADRRTEGPRRNSVSR